MTIVDGIAALTARAYYRTMVGGAQIERELQRGEDLLRRPDALRAHVGERLSSLLGDVARTTPFYQRLGLDPDSFRSAADLVHLPVVTKRAMQDAPADFTAAPLPAGSQRNQTGGSTGTPLQFWHDPAHAERIRVGIYRGYRWCGHHPGDRSLFLWGSDYDARAHRTLLGKLLDRFGYNRHWADAFALGPEELDRVAALAKRWRPAFLIAYTTSALLLARRHGSAEIGPLRGVQVTAELLTPTVRESIERSFRAPVFNRYGCREVGNIAHECEAHDGLHVFEDSHLLEAVDAAGRPVAPETPGRLLVTNFANRATPFLRYDLGDIGRLRRGACACGRQGLRLDLVEGRVGEIVTSPSGKWIHGEFFTHLFYKIDGVRRFRVVQEDTHTLRIQLESDEPVAPATLRYLDETIRSAGDPAFRVTFEQVSHIAPSPSGKHRFVESAVPLEVTS